MSDRGEEIASPAPEDSDDTAGDGDEDPGAITIWFGNVHYGKRLDDVVKTDMGYAEWCRRHEQKRYKWFNSYCDAYAKYEAWLEKKEGPINPGNATVWFGKYYRGNTFATMYAAKGHLRFMLGKDNEHYNWYYWLKRQTKKMDEWRERHQRSYRPRGPTEQPRVIGSRLNRNDDGAIDPNEEYEMDGFVVPDEDAGLGEDEVTSPGVDTEVQSEEVNQIESMDGTDSEVHEIETQNTQTESSSASSDEEQDDEDEDTPDWIITDDDAVDDDADYRDNDDFDPLDAYKGPDALPQPQPRMQTRSMTRKKRTPQERDKGDDEDEDEDEEKMYEVDDEEVPQNLVDGHVTSDAFDEDEEPPISPRTKRRVLIVDLSDEEEGPSRRLRKGPKRVEPESAHVAGPSDTDSEDEDIGPRPSKGRRSMFGKLMDSSSQDMS